MQKNFFKKYFLNYWVYIKKNKFIFICVLIIPLSQIFWIWYPFKTSNKSFKGASGWQILNGNTKFDKCINLLLGEKLIYSFISSSEVLFNINIEENKLVYNFVKSDNSKFDKGVFIPPNDGYFCLSWKNLSPNEISLNYNTQIIFNQEKNLIPVNFRLTSDNKSIQVVNGKGEVVSKIWTGYPIVNFAINKKSTFLSVSVSDVLNNLLIYDLNNIKIKNKFKLKRIPRFLVFSNDERFLILGDEHSRVIKRIDLKSGLKKTLTLPLFPIALFVDDNINELLIRTEKEVMKIKIDSLKLIERNARIEFVFGDETIIADPNEICTVHGIPHPLFTPRQVAMSPEGLSGYFFKSNLY